MSKKWFLRKPLKADFVEVDEEHHGLKRHLGWLQLVVIGIGAIIGAGIFVVTGKAAADYAGPAIVYSFLFASLICIFAGLCYAELSSLIPVSGGSYSYAYVALGELPAWIIGWCVTAQYLVSAATVAVGWSSYFTSFLKDYSLAFSDYYVCSPIAYISGSGWTFTGNLINIPAMLLVVGLSLLIIVGIKAAARLTNVMVVIKLTTVVLFILLGIPFIQSSNWTPFIPPNTGVFGEYGWSGVFRAAGMVFFAYIGFDTVSTLAQDTKKPQTDLPRGILGSLFVCTIAYILVAFILTGIVHYSQLNVSDPFAVALDVMGPNFFWLVSFVKLAILAGLTSVVLVQLLGQTRVFLAIGKDGLLPTAFAKIHPQSRTPIFATYVTAIITMLLAGLFPIEVLAQLVSMVTLFIFAIVCLGVIVLRYTHPEFHRPFRVPLVPWVPLLGILTCLGQMALLPAFTWVQLIAWLLIGAIVYFVYGIKNSKIRKAHSHPHSISKE